MNSKTFLMLAIALATTSSCTTNTITTKHDAIERKHFGDWEKDVGYCQVVRVGNTLYLAGVGGQGETQIDQMNDIYKTIGRILEDYKTTSRNIVKEVIYTTNIDELIAAKDARKNYYQNADYPSSTWVQVQRLYSPLSKIEIDVTVQLSGDD